MKTTKQLVRRTQFAALAVLTLAFVACKSGKDEEKPRIGTYEKGTIILSEGRFGKGEAAVTYYNKAGNKLEQEVFKKANNRPLGDVGQSMTFYDNKYYIVVNNSNKIEVVDMEFKSVATFENLVMPRYIEFHSGKCYVSCWGTGGVDGHIAVLSPATGDKLATIKTGNGPEVMKIIGNKLYVANSGGFSTDSVVSVINTTSDQVEKTIQVGSNPVDLDLDSDNMLWVLSGGKYNSSWTEVSGAGLAKINTKTDEVATKIDFPVSAAGARSLCSCGNNLYYLFNGGINKINKSATEAPTAPYISGNYYDLFYNNNNLYACNAFKFDVPGKVYELKTDNGSCTDSVTTGIGPSHILFRN